MASTASRSSNGTAQSAGASEVKEMAWAPPRLSRAPRGDIAVCASFGWVCLGRQLPGFSTERRRRGGGLDTGSAIPKVASHRGQAGFGLAEPGFGREAVPPAPFSATEPRFAVQSRSAASARDRNMWLRRRGCHRWRRVWSKPELNERNSSQSCAGPDFGSCVSTPLFAMTPRESGPSGP